MREVEALGVGGGMMGAAEIAEAAAEDVAEAMGAVALSELSSSSLCA